MSGTAILPLIWRARAMRFLLMLVVGYITLRLLAALALVEGEGPQSPVPVPWVLPGVVAAPAADPPAAASVGSVALSDIGGPSMRTDHGGALDRWQDAAGARVKTAAPSMPTHPKAQPTTERDLAPRAPMPTPVNFDAFARVQKLPHGGSDRLTRDRLLLLAMQLAPKHSVRAALRSVSRPSFHAVSAPSAAQRMPHIATDRWTASAWVFVRSGQQGRGSDAAAPAGQIGGSQAGVKLRYRLGRDLGPSAFARVSAPLSQRGGRELAIGIERRIMQSPVLSVAMERRIAVGKGGADRFAAYAVGGVNDMRLPAHFRLDAYGQAGVVGDQAFADGAVTILRPVTRLGPHDVRAGGVLAGAAQRGAARLDVGARAVVRLGGRHAIALDWRERVAGGAQPGSGLALTLGSDF